MTNREAKKRVTSARSKGGSPRNRRRTQEERSAETSGKLLKATIDLLLEKGYSRFRIADAAAKAKVSRGGQVHHFATKNDLIKSAIEQLFQSEVGQARTEAANAADAEIIRDAAQHASEFLASKLYQVSLIMLISAGESEHLADGVRSIFAESRAPIEEAWTSRMVQAGIGPEDAETVLGLLWSVQRAIVVENRFGGDPSGTGEGELEFTIGLLNEYLGRKEGQKA